MVSRHLVIDAAHPQEEEGRADAQGRVIAELRGNHRGQGVIAKVG